MGDPMSRGLIKLRKGILLGLVNGGAYFRWAGRPGLALHFKQRTNALFSFFRLLEFISRYWVVTFAIRGSQI